ncbi:MAG: segregation/condensation protein A, partial [Lachnospiraceae bacterium]|nr:segregation/condensation protein A [Lachnospiraceae bacterium]
MALEVRLQVFEGPLDLLLHLIDKNKIDIYDIPIVTITEQYLDYIRQMQHDDLEVTSEFLVMAATLLDIKCRMLLPAVVNEEGEEEDPRAELVEQLLQYKMYKYMSYELKDMQVGAELHFFRKKDLPDEV